MSHNNTEERLPDEEVPVTRALGSLRAPSAVPALLPARAGLRAALLALPGTAGTAGSETLCTAGTAGSETLCGHRAALSEEAEARDALRLAAMPRALCPALPELG
ncbi:hypothetical protein DV515_00015466 [Chloebia gouldiae]|uniref:Uncharacterized protein n=1 Tax=Chloebia gouldiae TaxID=44316 RepID=A0A3L8RWP4_CHLGU|nr:hypothetical protein DV515_00015466 [Chloebia gouldiae]